MGVSGRVRLLQGNEACVEGALRAGLKFYAGYPITPSTEIAELLAERLPKAGGVFIQMEDEIGSIAAVIGASLAGLKSMTATSGPGFSLMQENIGYAAMAEVPCVIVNVQRMGPSTGLPTSPAQGDVMQARWGCHGDHPVVVLCPSSVEETFHLTISAFDISEALRIPVILLSDEVIAHMRERVVLPEGDIPVRSRPRPTVPPEEYLPYDSSFGDVPPMASFGDGYRFHVTGLSHDESGFPVGPGKTTGCLMKRLLGKVESRRKDLVNLSEEYTDDAEILVFSYGSPARSALRAVRLAREEGIKAGFLKTSTLWPFPSEELAERARKARFIIVPEMNSGQIRGEVERSLRWDIPVIPVGRLDGELMTPSEVLSAIREAAGRV
ncbi:MAG TPA: 2-oxoacid:acceptor oxidoreductase subunit alpha [Clostridia bacterium]|nr:2-oxoacid:acceptor oxidoreductase subunit alpha [Clostridia bacterium]